MSSKLQLISSKPNSEIEKEANLAFLAAVGKNFARGLGAPVKKLFGGIQKTYGRGQQGVAAVRQGLGSSADDLLKNPLFQRGSQNVAAGKLRREQAGLLSGLKAPNPWSYRVGRGVGAATIGLPLVSVGTDVPGTIAQYAGAANADPALAEEYAKNMAYDRVEERLGQFENTPFLDRAKSIFNPQGFTQQFQMPEAENLYESISNNNLNNPGIMKYLASFNPFTGSPSDVIKQKVRSEMLRAMQAKQAIEKNANFGAVIKGLGAAWKAGKGLARSGASGAVKGVKALPASRLTAPPIWGAHLQKGTPVWEAALQKGVFNTAKGLYAPKTIKQRLAGIGGITATAATPFYLKHRYDEGKNNVYDAAANDAMGMADLRLLEQFNQPGFMGGLGRAGMTIAPGMMSDMLLNQIRQSMFPEVNRKQQ
jgi:hypothetical protein